jgi:hypothetical protein
MEQNRQESITRLTGTGTCGGAAPASGGATRRYRGISLDPATANGLSSFKQGYHPIVVVLSETIRLMTEIDQVINQHGGWPAAFRVASN